MALALTFATLAVTGELSGGIVTVVAGFRMLIGSLPFRAPALVLETWAFSWSVACVPAFLCTPFLPGLLAATAWLRLVRRIGAPFRVPSLPGQRPLQPSCLLLRLARIPRRLDGESVTGRDDAFQADVDPDIRARALLAWKRLVPDLELERHVPHPVRAADDRVRRAGGHLAMPDMLTTWAWH